MTVGFRRSVFLFGVVCIGSLIAGCGDVGVTSTGAANTLSSADTASSSGTTSASSTTSSSGTSSSGTSSSGTTPSSSAAAPSPAATAPVTAVTLSWAAPTENTDGTPLLNLQGYKVLYGTAPEIYTSTINIANPGLTTYVVDNLAPGTYYFAIEAYNSSGLASSLSAQVSATVD
jgi:hypothetical protein